MIYHCESPRLWSFLSKWPPAFWKAWRKGPRTPCDAAYAQRHATGLLRRTAQESSESARTFSCEWISIITRILNTGPLSTKECGRCSTTSRMAHWSQHDIAQRWTAHVRDPKWTEVYAALGEFGLGGSDPSDPLRKGFAHLPMSKQSMMTEVWPDFLAWWKHRLERIESRPDLCVFCRPLRGWGSEGAGDLAPEVD